MRLLALALLLPAAGAAVDAQRLTLQIKWTVDSSWKGEYYRKPYQFAVHEELEGRLVFDVADSSVRAVELRDNGATSGARLVEAAGVTAYRVDTRKEAGDCAPDGKLDAPLVGARRRGPPGMLVPRARRSSCCGPAYRWASASRPKP